MVRGRTHLISVLALLTAWTAGPGMGAAPQAAMNEYQVKAAFLYNFARLAEWPAEAASQPGMPFSICLLGADPFGHSLEDVVAGQAVAGRPVEIRRLPDATALKGCMVLFAGGGQPKRSILAALREPGVLTVTDSDSAASGEAMINFALDAGRVRFEVNMEAVSRGRVRLSSKLLSLAAAVKR